MALELMEVNQSHYPDTYYGNFIHAKALQHNQRYEAAVSAYPKVLEINPNAVFINRTIQKLKKQLSEQSWIS